MAGLLNKLNVETARTEEEAAAKREFAKEGLVLNFISCSRYLGAYLVPQAELEAWVKPQVDAWYHGVKVLAKIARRHPQSSYAGLGMSLQSEWKYLQRDVPGVGTMMGPIEEVRRTPKRSRTLNMSCLQGGGRGGGPPTQ